MESIWKEIRNTFEDNGFVHIDGYLTEDDWEAGKVIAKINVLNYDVTYSDKRAKKDEYAQNVIKETIELLKTQKTILVDEVIDNLKKDFAQGDYTVLEEILLKVPREILIHSLHESEWYKYNS